MVNKAIPHLKYFQFVAVLFLILVFCLVMCPRVYSEEWDVIESAFFTIYYESSINLKKVEKKLRKRFFFFTGIPKLSPLSSPEEKVAYRMDVLFGRTKEILDMNPPDMRVDIKIFSTKSGLIDEYHRIFKKKRRVKAFYVHKGNSRIACPPC